MNYLKIRFQPKLEIKKYLTLKKYFKKNNILSEPEKIDIMKTIKEYDEIERYFESKLEQLYNSFIFKEVLFTLRKFGAISEETKKTFRMDFLKLVEFNTNETEKNIFKTKFSFEQFKYRIVDYFNIKTSKLELFVSHKLEMDETEFKDYKLIDNLFNKLTTKEIDEILKTLTENQIKS